MDSSAVFAIQFTWFLVAWSAVAAFLVAPRLRGRPGEQALAVWIAPQLFRVLGVGLLAPNLAPGMPEGFAVSTALGDSATAALALLALFALHHSWPRRRAFVWVANVFGSLDLAIALAQAVRVGAAAHLDAQWYVPALGAPLMIVSHVMVFRALLTRPPE